MVVLTESSSQPKLPDTWKELGDDPSPPQRPSIGGHGTIGEKISLTTNYFVVNVNKEKLKSIKIYHYDVTIKTVPDIELYLPKRMRMMVFEELLKTSLENIAIGFDSVKNAYSTENISIPKKPYTIEIEVDNGRKKKFRVILKKVNEAYLGDLYESMKYNAEEKIDINSTVLQMIEVMFRHYLSIKYLQISRYKFISLEEEFARAIEIGGGKQGLTGIFGSLKPAAWKDGSILLNIDKVHSVFQREESVIKRLNLSNSVVQGPLDNKHRKVADKSLSGLKLRTTHTNMVFKFVKVVEAADDKNQTFDYQHPGEKVTVAEYMKLRYNKKLEHPSLNCLQVGNPEKNNFIPMELCKIEKGQKFTKSLKESEIKELIRSTAVYPDERLREIKKVASGSWFQNNSLLKSLSFTLDPEPLKTEGRILPAPFLTMKEDKAIEPKQGSWDTRRKKFHVAAKLKSWTVINYSSEMVESEQISEFIKLLVKMGKMKGMEMAEPVVHSPSDTDPRVDFNYFKKNDPDIQLIMFIIPKKDLYGTIKKVGDTEVYIPSQCVLHSTVSKCQKSTVGNILLKINAKMGGVNNIVSLLPKLGTGLMDFGEPFMIMGADVSHPPAGKYRGIPSLAAVVGSYDYSATKYAVELRSQYERMEIIADLETITKNLLMNYYKNARGINRKPQRLIMYRDGVSESEFKEVLKKEMKAIRNACLSLEKDYRPGITFICVQKGHHTRLFCDVRDGIGKSRNVPPGTIVDRDITHPTQMHFFLCSHEGIQGTSKPAQYHVLWDDNDFTMDNLQKLTYRLCHVYSRCSRSVSIPAPVYYAHLAAFRSKVVAETVLGDKKSEDPTPEQIVEIKRITNITREGNPLLKDLFFI